MKSKKIVYVVNVDWYFNLHWIERAEYFKSSGFTIHLITNFSDTKLMSKLSLEGYVCHHLPIKRSNIGFFDEICTIVKLGKIISCIDPDLIHCITVKPNVYMGLLNKFIFNKSIIYSVTGLGSIFSSNLLKFNFLRHFVVWVYRLVSTGKSHFIFENNEDLLLFKKLGIVKNNNGSLIKGAGIDIEKFKPNLPPNNGTILFAARLLEDKGLRCLIDALRILRKNGYVFSLNVAGIVDDDVSSAIPLSQIKLWADNGEINWLGCVQNMPELIEKNALVCLPTTYGEGVPRILIEAASCQRAIVATDVAGCREIVSHGSNGYLVEPNNPDSLAYFLLELLGDYSKLVVFGENGRLKVEHEFSQNIVFEKTHCIYSLLLGE